MDPPEEGLPAPESLLCPTESHPVAAFLLCMSQLHSPWGPCGRKDSLTPVHSAWPSRYKDDCPNRRRQETDNLP